MRNLILLFVLSNVLLISSCDDLIEIKLSGKTVEILAPASGTTLSSTSVTFWWNEVKGATKYNIQVVKPSFSNIQYLITDSMVVGDKFTYSFQPGAYEWRIKALNNSSQTDFYTFSFTIDSSLNLGNQLVQITSPASNFVSNQLSQTFSWAPVFYAEDYRFEVLSQGGNTVYVDAALNSTNASYTFQNEGTYTWRVRAQNSSSVSPYSQAIIVIDQTNPPTPVPVSPADNAIVTNPFTLSWSQTTDNGSSIYDSLYIYGNFNQDTLIEGIRTANSSYTDSLTLGDYYWKLRAIDSAGNKSGYSNLNKFVVQ